MQSSKILIFGGSFDPIHVGHTNMLNEAIKEIEPNLVYVVPNYISPTKDEFYSTPEQRIEMLNLAFKNCNNIKISDFEIKQKKSVKTWETIQHFLSIHPNSEFFLLIGSDQLVNFKQWYEYEKILENVKLVVYPRNLDDIKFNGIEYFLLQGPILDISSTKIRERVMPFELNEKVLNYINDNGIYAINRIREYESDHRFNHSLRVAYMAREIMNNFDTKMSNIAYSVGLYHDIAKEMAAEKQIFIANNILGIHNFVSYKVLHGYIGSYILKTKYLCSNKLILQAIDRHTLPYYQYDDEPNILDKVLYLADKLEPSRTDEDVFGKSVQYFRELAYKDVNKCFNELYSWLQENLKGKK